MAVQYECLGWVYHIGVNSVGHEYGHLRFLTIRGKSVAMSKRDPLDNPEIRGLFGNYLGRRFAGRRTPRIPSPYIGRHHPSTEPTSGGGGCTVSPARAAASGAALAAACRSPQLRGNTIVWPASSPLLCSASVAGPPHLLCLLA
ncbi:uncharacterized protein C2845_PM14G17570 [Panicum miliaceum]|uniref:Uncharacterized protein n=1 Tax=Panicum miliaceum TaxID=4540 RepID=A0A3L6PTS8_PANMI|nr:uncharacterized protein C2845_PM14G17570 [Panicum miliaceum]